MTGGNLISTLLGGILAIAGGISTQAARYYLKERRTRRAVAGALAGEISAICSIARRRDYLGGMREILDQVHKSGRPDRPRISVSQDYLQIYRSDAGSIGLLPPEITEDVVVFYTHVKSPIEDVLPTAPNPPDAASAERLVQEQMTLLGDTLRLGDDLIARLRHLTGGHARWAKPI